MFFSCLTLSVYFLGITVKTNIHDQHQPGRQIGNDAVPEFDAQVLPAGSAPASKTFQPNPIDEAPGQANNPVANETATSALDMPGATSGDVHAGYGRPASGQTSSELANDGKTRRARERQGLQGQAEGGSGLYGDENIEARNLQKDHEPGPRTGNEFNISLEGAESKESASVE